MPKINRHICVFLSLTTGMFFLPIPNVTSNTQAHLSAFCQGSNCRIENDQFSLKPASTTNKNRQSVRGNVVTGTVTYRQRIALPPGAVISIKLLDVSGEYAAAKIIAEQKIITTGQQVPIPFKLKFDPAKIKVNYSYVVQGEIKIKDKLAFTTKKSYRFITNQQPLKVDLVLEPVHQQKSKSQSIIGEWLLEDLAGAGVIDNLQTTIKFSNQGRLGGFGGCNNYFADYQIRGDKIKIGAIGATKKACPPAIMNQEERYFKALTQAYRIRLDKKRGFLLIYCQGFAQPLKFTQIGSAELVMLNQQSFLNHQVSILGSAEPKR